MTGTRIVFVLLLFTLPLASLFSVDVYSYYLDSKDAYAKTGELYAEYQIKQIFELAMLVNDSDFCRKIIHDYSLRKNKKPSDDLYLLFFRFAYKANDPELVEDIFKIIPLSIKMHLETAHHLYIEIISSDTENNEALANMKGVLKYLPDNFQNFYQSLLENRDYYLYFSPMTFQENTEVITSEGPEKEASGTSQPETAIEASPETAQENPQLPENESIAGNDKPAADQDQNIYIQVGSFSVKENADELVKELLVRKFQASISTKEVQGTVYYRVIVHVEPGYTLNEYLGILYEHGYGGIRF